MSFLQQYSVACNPFFVVQSVVATDLRSGLWWQDSIGALCPLMHMSASACCYSLLGCNIYPGSVLLAAVPAAQAAPDHSQHAGMLAVLVCCILAQWLSCFA